MIRSVSGFVVGLLLLDPVSKLAIAETTSRPNIVLFLLDNVGQEWFGSYGSHENATPNIDALARGGARFLTCYATPYCSTSRVMLLTGRYGFSTGWRFHHDAGIYGGGNFDWKRETTFARLLRDAGYATCLAGKWQINNFNVPGQENCLNEHGFQDYLVTPGGKTDSKYWDPLLIANGQRSVRTGRFGPDIYTDYVIDFIHRNRDKPFLVYFPITMVHTPLPETPETKGKTLEPTELFRANMRYADSLLAKVIQALEADSLRERTVIFVTSDNGNPPSFPAETDRGTIRGLMGTFIEPSINMPMIVNGPTNVQPSLVGSLTDFTDIFPTMMELAGVPIPASLSIDGKSYASWLKGEADGVNRDWVVTALNDERVIRDEQYKLYSTGEFYDVAADFDESHDLSQATDPEIVAARKKLETVLAKLPDDAPLGFAPDSIASRRYLDDKSAGRSTIIRRSR